MPSLAWNGTNYTTINGIPAQQNEIAAPLWESFFRITKQRYRAVEIGTGTGGFTRHIARFVESIDTFDVLERWHERVPAIEGQANIRRHNYDVLTPTGLNEVGSAIVGISTFPGSHSERRKDAELPVVLFIDGGNKPLEMKTFAPYLRKGDVIAVHDYMPRDTVVGEWSYWGWAEIGQDDVRRALGIESMPHESDEILRYDMRKWRRADLPFVYAAWDVWHKIL